MRKHLQPTIQNKPPLAVFSARTRTLYYRANKSLLEDGQVVDDYVPAKLVYQIAANYLFGDTGSGTMHVTFADGSTVNLVVNPADIGVTSHV